MAKPKIKHTITKKEWNKKHKDFKLMGKDGIPYIMMYDDKIGTHLVPVKIVESEIEEGIASTIDQIRQDSNDIRDFLKKVFSDSDFRDMKNDKDFLKYLKSIYEGVELESVNEGKFDGIGDLVKSLHFEINPKTAEEKKIELGKRQGEVSKPKQKESGEYSLRLFRKKIKYGNGKDVGVFLPGSYAAATSKLGDGPHKKAVKKVRWTQTKYEQWLDSMASNGGARNAFDMAQNAKNEPGLIDWVKKNFRGDNPLQRIQWDIEGFNESVNEKADYKYLTQIILDAKPKYDVYYNSGHNKVNIGGVGYDGGDLVKNFNQKPGSSSKIKNNFYHAHQDPQKTKREVEKLSKGKIKVKVGDRGFLSYSVNESVNEAYVVMYAKKKGEKPAAAAFQLRGSALSFERDLKKDGYITMVTQKKVKGIDESVNESKEEVTPQQLSKIQSDIRKINSKIKVYISKHPMTKGELSIELGAGHNDDSEIQKIYKVLKKHTGDWRTGTMFNESVNEGLPTKVTDKYKSVKHDKDSTESEKDFNKHHNTSMYAPMGSIAEPDTIDFDDDDKEGGYQSKEKDDKKRGYEPVKESNDVYHKSYTHAIEAAEVYAKKKGYEIEDDEMFTKVGMNSKRPSVGKTTRVSLELLKNGKPQRKMLHIQVYGMKNGYELNAYIN